MYFGITCMYNTFRCICEQLSCVPNSITNVQEDVDDDSLNKHTSDQF